VNLVFGGEGARILDFDIEARPLSWLGGDFVTREITAIAACWTTYDGDDRSWPVESRALTTAKGSSRKMLRWFLDLYNEADMVTGHYIRGYDLPNLNGALKEAGLPLLGPKLTCDTKLDLVKSSGVSKSQESLGAMLGLEAPKVTMTQADWREANRLTPKGVAKTIERVTGDVRQHIELRAVLLERGMLGPPRMWSPTPSGVGRYSP